jgi:hypothetical protein
MSAAAQTSAAPRGDPVERSTAVAVEFLRRFTAVIGAETICLVAIIPDGATETATFATSDGEGQRKWIKARQGRKNLYFTVNKVKGRPTNKPSKNDIAEAVAVWADIDPREGADFAAERERIGQLVFSLQFSDAEPSFVIDSGGGYQVFWFLDRRIALDGKDGPQTKAIEALCKRVARRCGADNVHNVDRIMRLPYTINLPNEKKRAKGRQPAVASMVSFSADRYSEAQLRKLSTWQMPETAALDGALRAKLESALATDDKLFARWHGDKDGLKDQSRSGFDMSMTALLKGHDFTPAEIGDVLRFAFVHGVGPDLDDRQQERIMPEGGKTEKTPLRDQLFAIGLEADLWHDGRGGTFATIKRGGHAEYYAVDSQAFKHWLLNEFTARQSRPAAPSATAVSEALSAIKARASAGPAYETFVRAGEHGSKIYLDLGSEKWDSVEVDADGWRVVPSIPMPMLRYAGMEPLPYPVHGGSIESLRQYLNLPRPSHDDMFRLAVAYCVASLFPRGPFMVLNLSGEQGSLKTTATRAIKRTVDPNKVGLRSKPRTEEDLLVQAERNHILAFENFSSINEELSDMLCRLATGGGLAKRALYTDKDETLLTACKPVIVNGIPDLITRGDLADRAIMIVLPRFAGQRRPDAEIEAEFDSARPAILGALLDGVSRAIGRAAAVQLPPDTPRMADFAKRSMAAFPTFGWPECDFMRIWRGYRASLADTTVENDSVARAVRKLMADRAAWEGTAEELLQVMGWEGAGDKHWPATTGHLSNRLRRAAPALRATGIDVDLDRRDGCSRRRIIEIRKLADHA